MLEAARQTQSECLRMPLPPRVPAALAIEPRTPPRTQQQSHAASSRAPRTRIRPAPLTSQQTPATIQGSSTPRVITTSARPSHTSAATVSADPAATSDDDLVVVHSTAPTRRSTARRDRLALSLRQRHAQRHHRHKTQLDSKPTKKASRNLFSVELDRSERTRPQVLQLRRNDARQPDQNPPAGLQPGQELWETGLTVAAPPAVPSRTSSTGRPHRTWLNFTRRYVHANYEAHIIGKSNLRYRNQSFAEHCHHATVDWDNHPFCPHCYMAFRLVECAKAPPGVQSAVMRRTSNAGKSSGAAETSHAVSIVTFPRTATRRQTVIPTHTRTITARCRTLRGSSPTRPLKDASPRP